MSLLNGAGVLRKTPLNQGPSFLTPCCKGRSFRRFLSVSTRRSNEVRKDLSGSEKTSDSASRRSAASQPPIAVLGAGLSGLTVALRLSRALPHRRIVIFESSSRLGGWVKSERIPIAGGPGEVVLESGPRSIRPKGASGWSMIELVSSTSRRSSPVARSQMLTITLAAPSDTFTRTHESAPCRSQLITIRQEPLHLVRITTEQAALLPPGLPGSPLSAPCAAVSFPCCNSGFAEGAVSTISICSAKV